MRCIFYGLELNLMGKTAIVTGGSAGIGLAVAKALYGEGVNVAIQYVQGLGITVDEYKSQSLKSIPLGKVVNPEDVAFLVLFLVSDLAGSITGAEVQVDGGIMPGI